MTKKSLSGKLFGVLLVLLRCLLGGSWGLLRRLGWLLEPLGGILGHLGTLLATSWILLGVSWRPLGALGELLGSLGGVLGASWRPLGAAWLAYKRKSGPGCSRSTILGAPRWPPWRKSGPRWSGSRMFKGPPGGRTGSRRAQGGRGPTRTGPPPLPKL